MAASRTVAPEMSLTGSFCNALSQSRRFRRIEGDGGKDGGFDDHQDGSPFSS